MADGGPIEPGVKTLDRVRPTLPASWYYDPAHYARELEAIWYRDWLCVGRAEALPRTGDFTVVSVGTQSVVVTRSAEDAFEAFHNTCRHRGARLCRTDAGRFRNGRVICPYHTWTYALDGSLVATPGRFETDDFDAANYTLYKVHVDTWRGFVFVNLAETPASTLPEFLGSETDALRNWPLESMRSVHQEIIPLACNWKIFWENYNECYHCPRVHPELCKVMPVYREGVFDAADLPGWQPAYDGDKGFGTVGNGAETWTLSGKKALPVIDGLTAREIEDGIAFASFTAAMFVVGHPDYVRSVCVLPTGPESIELTVDWFLPAEFEPDEDDVKSITELPMLVMQQDGEVCELNQRGVHCLQHEQGVLMPQEYRCGDSTNTFAQGSGWTRRNSGAPIVASRLQPRHDLFRARNLRQSPSGLKLGVTFAAKRISPIAQVAENSFNMPPAIPGTDME